VITFSKSTIVLTLKLLDQLFVRVFESILTVFEQIGLYFVRLHNLSVKHLKRHYIKMNVVVIGLLVTMLTLTVVITAKNARKKDETQITELKPKHDSKDSETEDEESEDNLEIRQSGTNPGAEEFFTDGRNYIRITNSNEAEEGEKIILNINVGSIGSRTFIVEDNNMKIDGKVLRPADRRDVDFGGVKLLANGTMTKHVVNDTFVTTSDIDAVILILESASRTGCGTYRRCQSNSHCCPEAPICSGLDYPGQTKIGGLCVQCFGKNRDCYRNDQCCGNRCIIQKCEK